MTATVAELCPQGKNCYCSLHSKGPSKDLECFLGLKDQNSTEHFLARPSPNLLLQPLFSIIGSGKRRQNVLPAPFFAVFHTSSLLSLVQSEVRDGKLLVDPGHLQEELVGGHPNHRYRRACRCHPVVDRALRKNTHIADDHAKK
jgi:hypothetical protein